MAQRNSEYERKPLDLYETPEWVTEAMLPHLGRGRLLIWEPCAGNGRMARILESADHRVTCSDIAPPPATEGIGLSAFKIGAKGNPITQLDFLTDEPLDGFDGIVTNPPFGREGPRFLRRALELTKQSNPYRRGFVAMLFPMDFDAAPGRCDLFGEHPAWHKKVVLTQRIIWFAREDGKKEQPSMHHAWYIWDWRRAGGPATLEYA